jgi:hypothetical protein
MVRSCAVSLVVVLLLTLVVIAAAPADSPFNPTASAVDNSSITLGVYWPNFLTHIRVDSAGGTKIGTPLTLEGNGPNELGLKKNAALFLGSADWRIGRKQNLDFEYTDVSRSATVSDVDFLFKGVTYTTDVTTHFDTAVFSVRYRYSFYDAPATRVGYALGIEALDLKSGVASPATNSGKPLDEDITVPIPELGAKLTQRLADKTFFNLYANFMVLKYKQWSGNAEDINAGFEYLFDKNVGVSLDWLYKRWDVSSGSGSFVGNMNYAMSGPALSASYYF